MMLTNGPKRICIWCGKAMSFDKAHSIGGKMVDSRPPIGMVCIRSSEDLILCKLIYSGLSQQSKYARDIAAILKSKKDALELEYIEHWVARLGLISIWKEMLDSNS